MSDIYDGAVRVQDKLGQNLVYLRQENRRVVDRRTGIDRRVIHATRRIERRIMDRRVRHRRLIEAVSAAGQ